MKAKEMFDKLYIAPRGMSPEGKVQGFFEALDENKDGVLDPKTEADGYAQQFDWTENVTKEAFAELMLGMGDCSPGDYGLHCKLARLW